MICIKVNDQAVSCSNIVFSESVAQFQNNISFDLIDEVVSLRDEITVYFDNKAVLKDYFVNSILNEKITAMEKIKEICIFKNYYNLTFADIAKIISNETGKNVELCPKLQGVAVDSFKRFDSTLKFLFKVLDMVDCDCRLLNDVFYIYKKSNKTFYKKRYSLSDIYNINHCSSVSRFSSVAVKYYDFNSYSYQVIKKGFAESKVLISEAETKEEAEKKAETLYNMHCFDSFVVDINCSLDLNVCCGLTILDQYIIEQVVHNVDLRITSIKAIKQRDH